MLKPAQVTATRTDDATAPPELMDLLLVLPLELFVLTLSTSAHWLTRGHRHCHMPVVGTRTARGACCSRPLRRACCQLGQTKAAASLYPLVLEALDAGTATSARRRLNEDSWTGVVSATPAWKPLVRERLRT